MSARVNLSLYPNRPSAYPVEIPLAANHSISSWNGTPAGTSENRSDDPPPFVTVRTMDECLSATVAVMTAMPSPLAVTLPVPSTVATDESDDDQYTTPSDALAGVAFTDNCTVLFCASVSLLFATPVPAIATDCRTRPASLTVTMTELDLPPTVAMMTAMPALTPRTLPVEDTVAMESSEEIHVTS